MKKYWWGYERKWNLSEWEEVEKQLGRKENGNDVAYTEQKLSAAKNHGGKDGVRDKKR